MKNKFLVLLLLCGVSSIAAQNLDEKRKECISYQSVISASNNCSIMIIKDTYFIPAIETPLHFENKYAFVTLFVGFDSLSFDGFEIRPKTVKLKLISLIDTLTSTRYLLYSSDESVYYHNEANSMVIESNDFAIIEEAIRKMIMSWTYIPERLTDGTVCIPTIPETWAVSIYLQ